VFNLNSSLTLVRKVKARRIFNSRGEETIEVEVETLGGKGVAAAPAGKSRGKYEVEYYPSGGVGEAIEKIEKIVEPKLLGVEASNQELVDKILHECDGTENFSNIGGNAAYAVSLAAAEAAASASNLPFFLHLAKHDELFLPLPLGNVLGGGKHAGKGAPDIQEFLVFPDSAENYGQAYQVNIMVHKALGKLLESKLEDFTGGKGDEGAWAPRIGSVGALELVVKTAEEVSAELGVKVRVGLDVAASSLWNSEKKVYLYASEGKVRDKGEQLEFILSLIRYFKLSYVEDPLEEGDFEGFSELTSKASKFGCLICGDDLFVTNQVKLEKGVKLKSATAIIIKPNQVGTLTDTWQTVSLALKSKLTPVASHRSGETCDPKLAHIAIAFGCPNKNRSHRR
jgi:enolase